MTEQKTKTEIEFDFMPYFKHEEKCYEETKIEGKDTYTGKKVSTTYPRDQPLVQTMYKLWLQKVKDPDTGNFYEQRDKNGNTIKGTGPKHLVKTIVRIRTNDNKEFLYSKGYVTGFDALGDVVSESCTDPETWNRVGFAYRREFDQKTMAPKSILIGPNKKETVYELPFTPDNAKALFAKRRNDTVTFVVKDARMVREVKDPTGIVTKTFELFATKPFEYLYNSDYMTSQLKAELRQRAIDEGILSPAA
ncbi:MAG: hypothetical protein M3530_06620 [Thermoproteota archaeon]|nr:hypothetical protein [Thermoproteota archaeon]